MNLLNHIKLKYKILIFPAIFIGVVAVIFLTTKRSNESVTSELNTVQYNYIPYNDYTSRLKATKAAVQKSFQDAVAAQNMEELANAETLGNEFLALADSAKQVKADTDYEKIDHAIASFNKYYGFAKRSSELMIQQDYSDEVSENVTAMISELEVLTALVDEISAQNVNEAFENAHAHLATLTQTVNSVLWISLALFIGLSFLLSFAISGPLQRTVTTLKDLASGNLQVEVSKKYVRRRDEVGDISKALESLVSQLKNVIYGVQRESNQISEISEQLEATSTQLAKGSNEQAAFVEEISSTMEEVSINISQNADNARLTNDISTSANKQLKEVGERSSEVIAANETINSRINMISEIAFQTNVLALNAAIEAARAGDAGKGFAVVASEVQMLAEKSKSVSDEIIALTQTAYQLSSKTGEVMTETIPKMEETSGLVRDITVSSEEQSKGANQVNQSIQQLNSLSQQSAASSEELAASAEQLADQAKRLKQSIAYYKLGGEVYSKEPVPSVSLNSPERQNMAHTNTGASKENHPLEEADFLLDF